MDSEENRDAVVLLGRLRHPTFYTSLCTSRPYYTSKKMPSLDPGENIRGIFCARQSLRRLEVQGKYHLDTADFLRSDILNFHPYLPPKQSNAIDSRRKAQADFPEHINEGWHYFISFAYPTLLCNLLSHF